MTLLLEVFDNKGDMFEVRPDVAKNLVLLNGWSLSKAGSIANIWNNFPATTTTVTVVVPEVHVAEPVTDEFVEPKSIVADISL